ncbi:S8 family peptidase, partial [Cryobacterium roopkundense]
GSSTPHGTQVASIAAYGSLDRASQGEQVSAPFPILSARVSENRSGQSVIVGNVVAQVEQALQWLHSEGARIAVVAFAYDNADDDPLPTELTVTLDRLAREYRMVLVVSAGNVREIGTQHWRDDYPHYLKSPSARIAAPGTAALAITVGAVAARDAPYDTTLVGIAPRGHPSPFTRTGPTRGNRDGKTQKPELVAPGGNFGWKPSLSVPVSNDPSLGVITLTGRNTPMFAATTGTSFAAPFVAHEVAKIATRYPDAGPNLLRAITALSAPPLEAGRVPNLEPSTQFAYGIPNADRVLESGQNRAILVFEGLMDIGTRVIHELPIPREFAQLVSGAERRVRIVLSFDPPVKRSRRNYVAGRMKFDFVRNMTLTEVKRTWEQQPTVAEREGNPELPYDEMPNENKRPRTIPGVNTLSSNTLIRRDISTNTWREDDEHYFLVVSHDKSPWTASQLQEHPQQSYALAIELVDEGRPELDLHGLAQARLTSRTRQRATR